jgi:hypothetical protein
MSLDKNTERALNTLSDKLTHILRLDYVVS